MATALKTVEFWADHLTTAADNTDTNFAQFTIYLPENSKTFRKVTVEEWYHDANTTLTGTNNRRQVSLQLAAAGYSAVNNTNTQTFSGENYCGYISGDFTSYFTTNWSGTSMTCDVRFLYDMTTSSPAGARNLAAKVTITYEYDDTTATQVKTVWIPLDAPVGALATSKPGSPTASIPDLEDYLPEGSKVFRNITFVVQGNFCSNATTDHNIQWQVDTDTQFTSQVYEEGGTQAMAFLIADYGTFTTSASHSWYLWSDVAIGNHLQAWLVVTYEFAATIADTTIAEDLDDTEVTVTVTDGSGYGTVPYTLYVDNEQMRVTARSSNDLTVTRGANGTTAATHTNGAAIRPCVLVSVMLMGDCSNVVGYTTSSDYSRVTANLYVEEPGPIATKELAFFMFWDTNSNITGFNVRLGTGSFVTYTDAGAVFAGGGRLMIRNDSSYTLGRGNNTFVADSYCSNTGNFVPRLLSGYFVVNYIAGEPTGGSGSANRTVMYCFNPLGTAAGLGNVEISAFAPTIPETNYFISNAGILLLYQPDSSNAVYGAEVSVERLSGESGLQWELFTGTISAGDQEFGMRLLYRANNRLFKRWNGDTGAGRFDLETSRRWRAVNGQGTAVWWHLALFYTYHTITATVAGDISNSAGGTVNIYLHRSSDGELLKSTTRSGNGAYSITWMDYAEDVFVEAYESGTKIGRSDTGKAVMV